MALRPFEFFPVMPYNPLSVTNPVPLTPNVKSSLFKRSSAATEPAAAVRKEEEMVSQLQAIFDASQKQLKLLSQIIDAFPPTLRPHHPKTPLRFAPPPSPSIEYGQSVATQHIAAQQMETFGMISPGMIDNSILSQDVKHFDLNVLLILHLQSGNTAICYGIY